MAKWGMVIDIPKCNACYGCFIACKDEYWENDYPPYSAAQPRHGQFWMDLIKKERGRYPWVKVAYIPVLCMQCDNAPCVKAAKSGAVYKRPDGIVIIDPKKAVGQRQIMDACPSCNILERRKTAPTKVYVLRAKARGREDPQVRAGLSQRGFTVW